MGGPIQCTLKGCYQRFPSVEAMKKHKAKMKDDPDDDVHDFYCKRCDYDCEDDVEYLIHQIQSPKHIVCPACGMEFKSEGGRDRHVGITHRQKQSLQCPGCNMKFTDAAGFMAHIEDDKCKIIKKDDFHRHRSEQQIERDVFDAMQGGMLHASIATGSQIGIGQQRGASLLEDQRVHVERDWQGAPVSMSPSNASDAFDRPISSLQQSMSDLGVDRYPPLQAERQHQLSAVSPPRSLGSFRRVADDDALLDASEAPRVQEGNSIYGDKGVWEANKAARKQRHRGTSRNLLDDDSNVSLMDSSISGRNKLAARETTSSQQSNPDWLPPAAQPENQDPNAAHSRIQTKTALCMPTRERLQTYWDSIQGAYVCPGAKCGRKLRSVQEFEEHLLSGAHAGGTVQCPACLKHFKTVTALVAHAESGSRKCYLRNTEDFDLAIRSITAGLIRVNGSWSGEGNARFEATPITEW